jgi:hypothetical protein
MTLIGEREIRQGRKPGSGLVWHALLNSGQADKTPYAIPALGLALSQTQNTGSRHNEGGGQQFSPADVATEFLQKQSGVDFGYWRGDPAEKRAAGIRRAQKWWADEGKAKYTFDYIENHLLKKGP